MKKIFNTIVVFALIFSIVSCEEVIDVDVPDAGERLVVEASISWEKGTSGSNQVITLSKSSPYFKKGKKYVKGASVSVKNETTGAIFNFIEIQDGNYVTNTFVPILNDTYSLNIECEGNLYKAKETMTSVVTIDSIKTTEFNFFGGERKIVETHYKDPEKIKNYYITVFNYKEQPKISFRNDKASDGNKNYVRFSEEELKEGDVVGIAFYGVSKKYFEYLKILNSQAGNNSGSPFQTPPAKVYGNCINVKDSEEEVFGFFRVCEFVKKEYTVE